MLKYVVMKSDFWGQFERGFTCLAPMEGVTDVVFRQVILQAGRPDVFFTEFTNVSSYASEKGRPNAVERLQFLPEEMPIVAQIWGVVPEYFEVCARGVAEMGYSAVDINMGCPDKNVVRNGGGSGLIRTPELAGKIIESVKKSGLAVSVKTRLGYSQVEEWREWLRFVLMQDINALTVHLRTKKEMSKVEAHHELVPEIVALRNEVAPGTKLIINGDIKNWEDGRRFADLGVDGIMIGRGVFVDPFCFRDSDSELLGSSAFCNDRGSEDVVAARNGGPAPSPSSEGSLSESRKRIELLEYHLDLFDQYEQRTFEPLKRFFKIYVNGFPGAAEVRERLMECENTQAIRDIIEGLEEEK